MSNKVHNKEVLTVNYTPNVTKNYVTIKLWNATNLKSSDRNGLSDPYIEFEVDGDSKKRVRSAVAKETINPSYNQTFFYGLKDFDHAGNLKTTLKVIAMDWDRFTRNDLIGSTECNIEFCKKNPGKKQEFTIDLKPQGKIHFEVTVFSARKELNV